MENLSGGRCGEETRAFVSGLGMELGDFTRSDAQAGELIAGIRRMDDSSNLFSAPRSA